MSELEQSIEVDLPVRTVYNQWTQFEEFPLFMEGVKSVRQLDDRHLAWHAEIAGKDVEWNAEITRQEPDQVISWHSTSGAKNVGTVHFTSMGANKTKVRLHLQYEPEGVRENAGAALGLIQVRVSGDLRRFKKFIEERGTATGAWRGEISGQTSTTRPPAPGKGR